MGMRGGVGCRGALPNDEGFFWQSLKVEKCCCKLCTGDPCKKLSHSTNTEVYLSELA